jgi:hypothetical protein
VAYLDIPIGRLWRLTVDTADVRTEYIVPERWLMDLVLSIQANPEIRNVQYVPYRSSQVEGVWMHSGPVLEPAA